MGPSSNAPSDVFPLRLASDKVGCWLLYSGWMIALLYFPSGLLHEWFGSFVYLRDGLLILHFFSALVLFAKMGRLYSFLAKSWVLLIVPLILTPALLQEEFRIEAAMVCKWVMLWLDWILLGRLLAQYFDFALPVKVLSAVSAALLLADLATGNQELQTNIFVFPTHGEVPAFGVEMGKDQFLEGPARIKGLQRDVFSFANLMGMSVVAGLCVAVGSRKIAARVVAGAWVVLFAWMLYKSGGRSTFFGVAAAGLLAAVLLLTRGRVRVHYSKVALAWLAIGLFISFAGVGKLTDSISSGLMKESHIGDSTSASMRDDNSRSIKEAIGEVPLVLITGSPLGSLLDSRVETIFHWADNNYLWLLYHSGFVGFLAVSLYFRNVLARQVTPGREYGRDFLMFFLLFVMGEAVARESLAFIGCMPLFVACGFVNGSRMISSSGRRSTEARPTTHPVSQPISRLVAHNLPSVSAQTTTSTPAPPKPRNIPKRVTEFKKSDPASFAERVARKARKKQPPRT